MSDYSTWLLFLTSLYHWWIFHSLLFFCHVSYSWICPFCFRLSLFIDLYVYCMFFWSTSWVWKGNLKEGMLYASASGLLVIVLISVWFYKNWITYKCVCLMVHVLAWSAHLLLSHGEIFCSFTLFFFN